MAEKKIRDAKDVMEMIEKNSIRFVDLKFTDFLGTLQHMTIPVSQFDESVFDDGIGFDGSSIRGWQPIHMSDMLVLPDPSTARIDPFYQKPTIAIFCDIYDPITKEPYEKDARFVAKKSLNYLKMSGIGDEAYFGPEAEFFVFDSMRCSEGMEHSFYFIDSEEGIWGSGQEGAKGYRIRSKEGYFPSSPSDTLVDLRNEVSEILEASGIEVEVHHHEVATGGQGEIDMKFSSLLECADNIMWFKYVLKNVAKRHNKTATFMPKPLFGDNGNGMHVHQSIWKKGKPIFAGDKYAGLSDIAMWYIGGILRHTKAFCAITNPTTNSYRRLVPHYEAPINIAYSSRNRSAGVRIPMYSPDPKTKRIEVRFPDPSCNPYSAFASMLMAGIDGIEKRIDPGQPMDKNIYNLPPEELKNIPSTPTSLEDALEELKKDSEFLMKGDVFTKEFLNDWITWKYEKDVLSVKVRPTPYEFHLYFDI